jgi:hexosaminidase
MLRFERILEVLRDLARWGYNAVLIEYEDRFPYRGAAAEGVAPDALTHAQIRELLQVASDLGLIVIPLVQSLGHLEWILRLESFGHLREESERIYGDICGTLCPSHPGSQPLFRQLAEQVLEAHRGCRYFHMGGDEAEVGRECPRCGSAWEGEGGPMLLVNHYRDLAVWLRGRGPDPIMWCDMPLRHPEALDLLRGHVVMMDWDYWSTRRPTRRPDEVWGIPADAVLEPRKWTRAQRELYLPYLLTDDGKAVRPFPFTRFLRDRGFPVITAPAARSMGDSFCVPMARHVENVLGAVRAAQDAHVLGVLVTSWALRRSPWPLTEYALIAGAMAMQGPGISRLEIDANFAMEHFGVDDPQLARIPQLLGRSSAGGLAEAHCQLDPETGHWFGESYQRRRARLLGNTAAARRSFAALRRDLSRARKLLQLARPRTPRQRERVRLWWWAHDVFAYIADFAPEALREPGRHDPNRLREHQKRAKSLDRRTDRLLKPMLTDWTLISEKQTRFGVHLDFLKEMRLAASRRSNAGKARARAGTR